MECLDLAADGRPAVGQLIDRPDIDPLTGEVFAGAVGGEHLHVEGMEFPGERRDPLPVRD